MSNGRVLISTHDLARARRLGTSFREAGHRAELVTPDEELSTESGAGLLVLTGGLDGMDHLGRQARDVLHIPVFVVGQGGTVGGRVQNDDGRAPGIGGGTRNDGGRAQGIGGRAQVEESALDAEETFSADTPDHDIALVGTRRIQMLDLQRETGIIGNTHAMREALERVVRFGPVEATVLVTGDSGTGKELFARALHRLSPRRPRSFIPVNVAALSDSLLESELFGHEKGAFTGAVDSRKGLFELAHHGTIFLDEIGDMPLPAQTNLLRVLEQREFRRVGGERMVKVDVRIVAATNQDLPALVVEGGFRRDLYYRLNVLSIRLPALRERSADIPALVAAFMADASERHGLVPPQLTSQAMTALQEHSWPGNVRELRNLVESMVILAPRAPRRAITVEDLPYEVRRGGSLGGGVALVRAGQPAENRPEPDMEIVLRSLIDLKADLDDLRREFEHFKAGGPDDWRCTTPVVGHIRSGAGTFGDELTTLEVDEPLTLEGPSTSAGNEIGGANESVHPGEGARRDDPAASLAGMTMEEIEREAIKSTLEATGGNRRKTAKILGIGERTLYRKIAKFDL